MALQRAPEAPPVPPTTAAPPEEAAAAQPAAVEGQAQPVHVETAMMLSTRDVRERPCLEMGVVYGRALGKMEPVLEALSNLQEAAKTAGCEAVLGIRLMPTPMRVGTGVIAYGTGVRWLRPTLPERRRAAAQTDAGTAAETATAEATA